MNNRPDWITDEAIRLCIKIAEKYRKEIKAREYFYNIVLRKLQWCEKGQPKTTWAIPLWTLFDAIEWLKERYDDVNFGSIQNEWDVQLYDAYDTVHHPEFLEDIRSKTLLEACLEAILTVSNKKKE